MMDLMDIMDGMDEQGGVGKKDEYLITNSRSAAKTGFSVPKAMTLVMSTNIQFPRKDKRIFNSQHTSFASSAKRDPISKEGHFILRSS